MIVQTVISLGWWRRGMNTRWHWPDNMTNFRVENSHQHTQCYNSTIVTNNLEISKRKNPLQINIDVYALRLFAFYWHLILNILIKHLISKIWNNLHTSRDTKNLTENIVNATHPKFVSLKKKAKSCTRMMYMRRGKTVVIWKSNPQRATNVIMSDEMKLSSRT